MHSSRHLTNLKLIALSVFASLAVACGNSDIDAINKLKDEACACKDKACAEAVNKKLDAKLEKMSEPSESDGKKLMEAMTAAGICIAKLQ